MDVYCADVGSVSAGNFGWASSADGESTPREGNDIVALAKSVTECLESRKKVALGFECPLYIPLHEIAHVGIERLDAAFEDPPSPRLRRGLAGREDSRISIPAVRPNFDTVRGD